MNLHYDQIGALVLRLTLGFVLIAHGILKFYVFTLAGTAGFFASVGVPGWTAYLIAPFEVAGGLALLLGLQTRAVALASIVLMAGATWVHLGNGWLFTNKNGGWEYPFVLIALSVAVALIGGGTYTVNQLLGRRGASLATNH